MTITPHQHSFLAIACLAQEHFEFMDHRMSVDGSVSLPDEVAAARVRRYYNDAEADLHAGAVWLVQSQLGTFVSQEALSVPAAQSFIAQCADDVKKVNRYQRHLRSSREFHDKAPAISIDNTDPDRPRAAFRPIRETQVSIIIGAYLSLPDGFRTWARTADLLNRGIPTGDRGGLNDGHACSAICPRVALKPLISRRRSSRPTGRKADADTTHFPRRGIQSRLSESVFTG